MEGRGDVVSRFLYELVSRMRQTNAGNQFVMGFNVCWDYYIESFLSHLQCVFFLYCKKYTYFILMYVF